MLELQLIHCMHTLSLQLHRMFSSAVACGPTAGKNGGVLNAQFTACYDVCIMFLGVMSEMFPC